jgi:hypothetical protein
MEPFSVETLTILILIAVILAGVTFIAVFILIICLLCIKYHRSNTISPVDTRSITSSISSDSHLSSVSSIPIKNPVVLSNKRKKQSSRPKNYHPNSMSILYERPYNNQNKHQQVYKNEDNDETTVSESRVYIQRHQERQQQRFKPITNVRFIDRHTPYPPDVLARERIMMNHLQISNK